MSDSEWTANSEVEVLMPFCRHCGNKVLETSKFCPNCSTQLGNPPAVVMEPVLDVSRTPAVGVHQAHGAKAWPLIILIGIVALIALSPKDKTRTTESPNAAVTASGIPNSAKEIPADLPVTPAVQKRKDYANLVQLAFRKEGRLIKVGATGQESETLSLSSGLIREGSYTEQAALRETSDCDRCMQVMQKLKFTEVVISGSEYNRRIPLP